MANYKSVIICSINKAYLEFEDICFVFKIFIKLFTKPLEEIAQQFKKSGARYVITIGIFLDNIRAACAHYNGIKKIIVIGMDGIPEDCVSFISMIMQDDGKLYAKNVVNPLKLILE